MADTGRRAPLAPTAQTDTQAADETRMRRALGLGTGSGQHTPQQRPEQARARHRFVQDGGVPVVMLNQKIEPETAALRERIATLEGQLETERSNHETMRRQLKEQAEQVTALQTRLAHNELAHRDALQQERHMRVTAQEALQEALANAGPRRRTPPPVEAKTPEPKTPEIAPPEAVMPELAAGDEPGPLKPVVSAIALDPAAPVKRGRGRPRSTTPPEPKPVRWWTPSFRNKGKS